MRRQEAGQIPAASCRKARGGQGVHREMESEGPASNLRAVAEAKAMANRSAMSALIRAGSLTAKEIPAERAPRHGVCGRHGGTEERLTWGDLVASSEKVFMPPGWGRRAGGVDEAIRQSPKRLVDAQREVRALVVVRNRGESRGTGNVERRAWPGPKGGGQVRRGATGRERRETDADE
jgi:hypothetical protein